MNYQGTAYSYNQRSEILLPTRRGTTYYGTQNHKPLIAYEGVVTDFEFFVSNTDRKPVSIENKTPNSFLFIFAFPPPSKTR